MASSSRPRRSTAPTTFVNLLQPISLSSSSSSSDSETTAQNKRPDSPETIKRKKLKKRKTSFIPEQDSESEFELEQKEPNEEGGEEESEEDEEEGVAESEDQETPDEKDMSDIASSAGLSDEGSPGGKKKKSRNKVGRSTKTRRGGANDDDEGGGASKGPRKSIVVTRGTNETTASTGDPKLKKRAIPPPRHPLSGLDPQYASFGPHYFPPCSFHLSRTSTEPFSTTPPIQVPMRSKTTKPDQVDRIQSKLMQNWTANPFAPERDLVRDLGWEKGKWVVRDEDDEENRRVEVAGRWGGWYPEVTLDESDFAEVDQASIDSRLPEQNYHARSRPFHSLSKPLDPPPPSTQATGEDSLDSPSVGTPRADNQDSTTATATNGVGEERSGRRKLLAGGIPGLNEEREVTLERFESIPLKSIVPRKPGHLFNVGGPVSSLSWLPRLTNSTEKEYLAISTISSPSLTLSHPPNLTSSKSSSLIQIWSLDTQKSPLVGELEDEMNVDDNSEEGSRGGGENGNRNGINFELGMLIGDEEGEARQIQWCPRGGSNGIGRSEGDKEKMDVDEEVEGDENLTPLGILGGVFTDGKVKVFVVPRPESVLKARGEDNEDDQPVYVRAKKVLELSVADTSCLSFAWGSWEMIAAGCMNGYVAVWHIGDALREGLTTVRPIRYLPTNMCAIRSITFITTPPVSTSSTNSSTLDLDGDPQRLATVGYDGNTAIVDLRESGRAGVGLCLHERSSVYSIAYGPHAGCIYSDDAEDRIRAYYIKSGEYGGSKRIGAHRGTIWSIATSPHHPFVASSSSDGTLMVHSGVRALRKRRVRGHYSQKVYEVDFDREKGTWRMKDNFLVEHRMALDSANPVLTKSKKATAETTTVSSVAWPLEVQLNAVAWHPNLERSALVASGGNWGLVRIDWVEGTGVRD